MDFYLPKSMENSLPLTNLIKKSLQQKENSGWSQRSKTY